MPEGTPTLDHRGILCAPVETGPPWTLARLEAWFAICSCGWGREQSYPAPEVAAAALIDHQAERTRAAANLHDLVGRIFEATGQACAENGLPLELIVRLATRMQTLVRPLVDQYLAVDGSR